MADLYRILEENFDRMLARMRSRFDRQNKKLDELTGMVRATNQYLADLQLQAQQPRLATETGVEPDTKTRKRMEGAAAD